jgi:hypothetical protein
MTREGQAALPTETEFFAMIAELAQSWTEWARLRSHISSIQAKAVAADDPLVGQVKKYVTANCIATLADVERRQADIVVACRRLRKAGTSPSWLDAHDPDLVTTRRQLQEVRDELTALRTLPRHSLDTQQVHREEVLVPEEWRLEARIHNRVEKLLVALTQQALADGRPADAAAREGQER